MFIINNVLMRPDNLEESIELIEDELLRLVVRPFPNLDAMSNNDRIATTFAITAFIVDKTIIDYGADNFNDKRRFEIIVPLLANAIARELNEYAPIDTNMFSSMFKTLLREKFEFLFRERSILLNYLDNFNKEWLSAVYRKVINDNASVVISAHKAILNQ